MSCMTAPSSRQSTHVSIHPHGLYFVNPSPGKHVIGKPERSEPGGSGGFPLRKEDSHRKVRARRARGVWGVPPRKEGHTKATLVLLSFVSIGYSNKESSCILVRIIVRLCPCKNAWLTRCLRHFELVTIQNNQLAETRLVLSHIL